MRLRLECARCRFATRSIKKMAEHLKSEGHACAEVKWRDKVLLELWRREVSPWKRR